MRAICRYFLTGGQLMMWRSDLPKLRLGHSLEFPVLLSSQRMLRVKRVVDSKVLSKLQGNGTNGTAEEKHLLGEVVDCLLSTREYTLNGLSQIQEKSIEWISMITTGSMDKDRGL
jgi:hypothetical protein